MKAIDRFYKYLNFKGVKATRFEKDTGLSNGYLGKQRKRKGSLGEDILNTIIDNCPDINPYWLLSGVGEMLKHNSGENKNQQGYGTNNSQVVVNGNNIQTNNIGNGSNISGDNNVVSQPKVIYGNGNNLKKDLSDEVFHLKKENEHLKEQLKLKNEIIELLKNQK